MKNIIFLGLIFIFPSTSLLADYAMGLEAYNNEDYATALKEWEPLAEQGDVDAQYHLGVMYTEGEGVDKNHKTAFKFCRCANKSWWGRG